MAEHLDNGRIAETLAHRFLVERGLTPVTANYRCRFGELDLIMRDSNRLVIVETRYRRRNTHGGPMASISASKRRKIVMATQHFIRQYPSYRNAPVRFDVIGIDGELTAANIHWIAGAFTMDELIDA